MPRQQTPLSERLAQFPVIRMEDGVPIRDNGQHEFYETEQVIVLRNYGEAYWTGMVKVTSPGAVTPQIVDGAASRSFAEVLRKTLGAVGA